MKTLIVLVGLPRSGKTTWAFSIGPSYPVVSPDAIRLALHGQRFITESEPLVWVMAEYMAKSLFFAGHKTVIIDGCHVSKKRRDFWREKFEKIGYEVCFKVIETGTEECIKRAKLDSDDAILSVIERMVDNWEPLDEEEIECDFI